MGSSALVEPLPVAAGIMEASVAAIELRRQQQESAQSNVAERREAQAAQEQQGLPSVSPCTTLCA